MKVFFKILAAFFLVFVLISLLFAYGFYIEPNLITINKEKMTSSVIDDNLKIVIFSDTHIKNDSMKMDNLITNINEQNADIVVFLGDLIDDYANNKPDIHHIEQSLSNISAKYGKYAIMGNHDYGGGAEKIYKSIIKNSGFNLLINETVSIEGRNITISGLDDYFFGNPDLSILEKLNDDNYNIILSHVSDLTDKYRGSYSISLAGHSHGGQVNLPIIRDYILPEGGEKYYKGMYSVNNKPLFVTSGVGTTRINFRLFTMPEIVTLEIKKV